MEIQLRVMRRKKHNSNVFTVKVLQQRTKSVWVDGSMMDNGYYTWDKWQDVPIVDEE